MTNLQQLPEILQQLSANGYSLADAVLASLPEEAILSNDWRLDSVHRVYHEIGVGGAALVIAVSSVQRCLKLVFVETPAAAAEFSPLALMRRLFPMRRTGRSPQGREDAKV